MKKSFTFLFLVCLAFCPSFCFADFVVGNIRYSPINATEAKVTGGSVSNEPLIIPATVYDEDEDITYDVVEIGDGAFDMWGGDGARINGSVTLPSTIRRIGDKAFNYQSFSSINLPEGLVYIGANAFEVNRNLHSIVIPSTVEEIGNEAFCRSGLSYFYVLGSEPFKMGNDVFLDVSGTDDDQNTVGFHIVTKKSSVEAFKGSWIDYVDVITTDVPVTIKGEVPVYAGYGVVPTKGANTFCAGFAYDFSGADGLKAYIVKSVSGGEVEASEIQDGIVPAGMGVILKGEKDKTYNASIAENQQVQLEETNLLVGVLANTKLTAISGDTVNYVFNDGVFTKFDDSDTWRSYVRKNTAYLPILSSEASEDSMLIKYDGVTDGIQDLNAGKPKADNKYYRIDGTVESSPSNGLYIYNGKKIILK